MPELMWYEAGGAQGLTSGLGLLMAGDGGGGAAGDKTDGVASAAA